jgi:hypothetical protein
VTYTFSRLKILSIIENMIIKLFFSCITITLTNMGKVNQKKVKNGIHVRIQPTSEKNIRKNHVKIF